MITIEALGIPLSLAIASLACAAHAAYEALEEGATIGDYFLYLSLSVTWYAVSITSLRLHFAS